MTEEGKAAPHERDYEKRAEAARLINVVPTAAPTDEEIDALWVRGNRGEISLQERKLIYEHETLKLSNGVREAMADRPDRAAFRHATDRMIGTIMVLLLFADQRRSDLQARVAELEQRLDTMTRSTRTKRAGKS